MHKVFFKVEHIYCTAEQYCVAVIDDAGKLDPVSV